MHEVLVNRLGSLSLPRKSVVRLIDHPDMTLDVYRGRKTTMQCNCRLPPNKAYGGAVFKGSPIPYNIATREATVSCSTTFSGKWFTFFL